MTPIFVQLLLLFIPALVSISVTEVNCQSSPWNPKQTPYPKVARGSKTFSFRSALKKGNVTVADPYFDLEKPIASDPGVIKFINDQMKLTDAFINKCKSKDAIAKSIKAAFDFNDYNGMELIGDIPKPFYIYSLKGPNDNRPVWYTATPAEVEAARKENFAKPPGKKFLDEMKLSQNGTANIQYSFVSPDGKYFAYIASDSNSDVAKIFIREIDTPLIAPKTFPPGGEGALKDVIGPADGNSGFVWTKDSTGFFYVQVNDDQAGANTEIGSTVRYHKLGTAHEKDITIVKADKPGSDGKQNYWFISNSLDYQWLLLQGQNSATGGAKVYLSLLKGQTFSDKMKWISISPGYDYLVQWIDVIDNVLYAQTNRDALDSKIVQIKLDWSKARSTNDLSQLQDRLSMQDIIPEQKFMKISALFYFDKGKLILVYIKDGRYVPKLFQLPSGKFLNDILPKEEGSISSAYGTGSSMILHYAGTTSPKTVYEIGFDKGKYYEKLFTRQTIKGTKSTDFITEHLFATSKDGTKIPYAIQYRKETKKDGTASAFLHTYGSNGMIENYLWDAGYFSWLNSYNTFFVWASPRGGGDRGEEWHVAGRRKYKPVTFDDIIAIGQDLIKRKIAGKGKVIAEGGSAGGMAVAAVANRAPPDVFGVIFPERAVCDVFLRQRSRNGAGQIEEYGDVNNATDFDTVLSWSPLQNVNNKQQYPAILLQPGDSDDRVVAGQSFKFLAELQYKNPNNPNPFMLFLARNAGHTSSGLSTDAYTTEMTYQQCFAEVSLNLKRLR